MVEPCGLDPTGMPHLRTPMIPHILTAVGHSFSKPRGLPWTGPTCVLYRAGGLLASHGRFITCNKPNQHILQVCVYRMHVLEFAFAVDLEPATMRGKNAIPLYQPVCQLLSPSLLSLYRVPFPLRPPHLAALQVIRMLHCRLTFPSASVFVPPNHISLYRVPFPHAAPSPSSLASHTHVALSPVPHPHQPLCSFH